MVGERPGRARRAVEAAWRGDCATIRGLLFPTVEYALFFLGAFGVAWALRGQPWLHKLFLLLASYAFYAFWDWRYLPLLVGLSLLAGLVARLLQREQRPRHRTALLATGCFVSLSLLAFYKYATFAVMAVAAALEPLGVLVTVQPPDLAVPVGISFFVFHAISLMVDAWRGHVARRIEWVDALLYVAFFPQLVAGPILRAKSFLPQLAAAPDPERIEVTRGLELFLAGLFKKVVLANFLATRLVDPAFESPGAQGGLEALLAIYGYAGQIYCDFSGYTDMAIGSALLLGYRFPENFDRPYLAASPQDFWRRWHISLSSWLRDYLFIPLGGSRGSAARTAVNLAVTMILGGLWHGAAWTFVAWGALHGAALVLHRVWSSSSAAPVQRLRASRGWALLAPILTFHFVCVGWVLFRAPTFDVALSMLAAVALPWRAGAWLTPALGLAVLAGLATHAVPSAWREVFRERSARLPYALQGAAFAALALVVDALGPKGVLPFIYFQF